MQNQAEVELKAARNAGVLVKRILILILVIIAIIGQGIIICAAYWGSCPAIYGIGVNLIMVWPINKLWRIHKESMAMEMSLILLEGVNSEKDKRNVIRIITKMLSKDLLV